MQPAARQRAQQDNRGTFDARFPLWLKMGFWACIAIAVAVVLRRAVALLASPGRSTPPQLAALDSWFATHAALTWAHILCALAFVACLPFIFRERAGNARLLQRTFFLLGGVTGVTAYAMSVYAVGGWLERSAVLFFNTAFLASLATAYNFMRCQKQLQQRRWMTRTVAILLGIATTRPVMGILFATAPLSHLTPRQFFGVAFWIGFSFNTVVIELWLRKSAAEGMRA